MRGFLEVLTLVLDGGFKGEESNAELDTGTLGCEDVKDESGDDLLS